MRDPGKRVQVERLGVSPVHRIAGAEHPAVELLDGTAHPGITP
jgi:hypothetical protein